MISSASLNVGSKVASILLYLRLPPAELPDTQNPSCSLMVQVGGEARERGEAGVFSSMRVSGFTLQSSTTSNRLERSSALILIETMSDTRGLIVCETDTFRFTFYANVSVTSWRKIMY